MNEPMVEFGAGGLGLMAINILDLMGGKGAVVLEIDVKNVRQHSTAARSRQSIPRCLMLTRKFARRWEARITLYSTWWAAVRQQRRDFVC